MAAPTRAATVRRSGTEARRGHLGLAAGPRYRLDGETAGLCQAFHSALPVCWIGVTSMPLWTCEQCGAQFPESGEPPASCLICEDERQFVNWKGQTWLAREQLTKTHTLVWRDDLGILGIGVEPAFAIGQRALLVREADGCVLWDCVPLLTNEVVAHIRSLGGLKAIAVSHPHYYGAIADWSEAFGGVPIYLHGDDRAWITRPHPAIKLWSGESHQLSHDILLVRSGG